MNFKLIKMKKTVLILLVGLMGFIACKKYDEGPLISFTGKKKRISGTWHINDIIDERGASISFNKNNTMTLDKNGTVYVYYLKFRTL